MKKYKLIIWDVGGTMLDTSAGLINSTRYMIEKLKLPEIDEETLLSFVGPRIQDSLARVYRLKGETLSEAAGVFRNHYKQGDVLNAKPYDGIVDLIKKLHEEGQLMAVATNKRQDFTDSLMEKYGFDQWIPCIQGTDMNGKFKKVDLIRKCLDFFEIKNPQDAVMIGDSCYDAEAAQEAGVKFIGVTYGFEFRTKDDVDRYENDGCAELVSQLSLYINIYDS